MLHDRGLCIFLSFQPIHRINYVVAYNHALIAGFKPGLLPFLVNKVLLEDSQDHSFTYRLWLFSLNNSQANYLMWQRICGPKSQKYLLCVSFRKGLLPWPGSSVGWSIVPVCQGYGFNPQPGHIQESTNE